MLLEFTTTDLVVCTKSNSIAHCAQSKNSIIFELKSHFLSKMGWNRLLRQLLWIHSCFWLQSRPIRILQCEKALKRSVFSFPHCGKGLRVKERVNLCIWSSLISSRTKGFEWIKSFNLSLVPSSYCFRHWNTNRVIPIAQKFCVKKHNDIVWKQKHDIAIKSYKQGTYIKSRVGQSAG